MFYCYFLVYQRRHYMLTSSNDRQVLWLFLYTLHDFTKHCVLSLLGLGFRPRRRKCSTVGSGWRTGKGPGERGSPREVMEREGLGEQPPKSCFGNAGLTPRPHTRGVANGAVDGPPPAPDPPLEGPHAGEKSESTAQALNMELTWKPQATESCSEAVA